MTDLEKMARAIEPEAWAIFDDCGGDPTVYRATRLASLRKAKDALKAIREPSWEAADIGNGVCDRRCKEGAMANCIFTAMIDHIIAQGEAG